MSSYNWPPKGTAGVVTTIDGISGDITLVAGTNISITDNSPTAGSITIAGSGGGDVTIAAFGSTPNANGLSLSSQVLNMQPADATHPGGISVADWNTFNNKQAAGSYITALTGGVTASGPGSSVATVVTNANLTGPITSVGNATAIASQTGTGSVFVVQNTPTLTTPVIGAATGTSLSVSGQLTSTIATGTAPFVVSSTTQVANLNAATAGSATSATTATNAINTAITDDTTTNATMFPTWVTANSGNLPQKVSSTKLTFNPSTAVLTTTTFVGALTGTASGNTTYTANNHGVVLSSATNAMVVIAPNASTVLPLISGGASADPAWGVLALGGGGTGATTKAGAFDALSPMSTGGDIIYGGASGTGTRLANGSAGQVLTSAGATSAPTWSAVAATSFGTQTANFVLAGPTSGSAATPTFRAVVPFDGLGFFPTSASKTSNYTLTTADYLVQGTAAGGAFTFTLPTAVGAGGQRYVIERTDQTLANVITINTTSSQTIDGVLTKHLVTQWERWVLVSDNANWRIESHTYPSNLVAFTPALATSGGGAVTLNATGKTAPQGAWWRQGSQMFVTVSFKNGSGGGATGNAGDVQISVPSTPDTTQMFTNVGFGYFCGSGEYLNGATYPGRSTASVSGSSFILNKIGAGGAYQVSDIILSSSMNVQGNFPVASWDE